MTKKAGARKKPAGRKTARKKSNGRKTASKKAARKKSAGKKTATKTTSKQPESASASSEGFFILLDDPAPAPKSDDALRLPADCRTDAVTDLKQALVEALSADGPIVIDAADLKHVDAAALQLLFAFARDAANGDRNIDWKNVPAVFGRSASSLGLSAHLPPD